MAMENGSGSISIQRDVEAQLLNKRTYRRKPGDVPYPLEHHADTLDFDIWDHMFLSNCCRSLTMHQFDAPPAVILDLGCGSGYWALEAAKLWTDSTVIGFDIQSIQPRLNTLPRDGYGDLARRVRWVQGNLLEGLPFPPDHFDFVRIAGIGLGVPEDEWQFVLEEVSRTMKPGAVVEIIEEDLIFPCPRPPRPRPSPINVDIPHIGDFMSLPSSSKSSMLSELWTPSDQLVTPYSSSSSSMSGSMQKKPSLHTLQESPESSPIIPNSPLYSLHSSVTTSTLPHMNENDHEHEHERDDIPMTAFDPQDHTRLRTAWEAMLSTRFLAAQLTTVLPFYISSSFVDVQSRAPMQIPLPPNTRAQRLKQRQKNASVGARGSDESAEFFQERFDVDILFDLAPRAKRARSDTDVSSSHSGKHGVATSSFTYSVPAWATMHLAKTVKSITGCKESIWTEYEKLYGNDPSVPKVTQTSRPKQAKEKAHRASAREGFEDAWSNWENDMMDRIAMRGYIGSELSWNEPLGDLPDWRVWRAAAEKRAPIVEKPPGLEGHNTELCRSIRGFVGWKQS